MWFKNNVMKSYFVINIEKTNAGYLLMTYLKKKEQTTLSRTTLQNHHLIISFFLSNNYSNNQFSLFFNKHFIINPIQYFLTWHSHLNGLFWQKNWPLKPFIKGYRRQSMNYKYVFKKIIDVVIWFKALFFCSVFTCITLIENYQSLLI